jgi:carboxypeptidase family protein/TonB-dependent receptor-like protein
VPLRPRTLLVWFCLASASWAQTSLVSGALDGSVGDSSGGRIPGATVTVRDTATNRMRAAPTNAEGAYHIAELPVGTYEVLVNQAGFAPYRHTGVTIQLGATVHLDIELQAAGVTTQVTVTAQPPAIDPAQISVTSGVDRERIEELPVQSRNYLNFVLLAPGVASSAQQPGKQALGSSPDSGFNFGGLRGRSNNVTIDGLDNNDEYTGSSRTELSLEIVQEFQVVNAGLSAETGGASGGSINVVTRTAANQIHGDAFLFLQNGALDARNPFETERATPDLHRYRAGFSQGGPIVKDRTFYYAAFEQEHNRSLDDSFISPATAASVNRVLAGGAFPRLATQQINDGFFPTARVETEASAKVNHQLTSANSLMLRYAFTNNREAGDAFNTAGWTDPSARGSSFVRDNAFVGSLTTVFNPRSIGDLRFQFADRRVVLRTNDATGPGIDIAGLVNFGRPYDGNGRRTETHRQATYTYTHSVGRHLLKAGATVNHVHLDAAMADGFGGTYIFAGLADFAAGRPDSFRQAFGSVDTGYAVTNYGVFLQDHWSLAQHLTVDLGVRYDFEHLPPAFPQDTNNVSPRVGLAYQPAPGWVVRAGYGIFFDRYILSNLNRAIQKDGVNASELVLYGDAAAAFFGAGAGGPFAPFKPFRPSIYRSDSGLATPYSQQASFSVERLLARDLTATASYLFVRGVKLPRTRNVNLLPMPPIKFGSSRVVDPRFDNVYQLEDSASSTYHGVSFAFNRRMSNELAFSGSYTLSKTFDDASDFNEQPGNPFHLAAEQALSLQHQQQRAVFNGLWELPIGDEEPGKPAPNNWVTKVFGHIEVAPIFTVESGRPVNPLTGVDSSRNGAFPLSSRPFGFGRNSLRSPALANMDFRVLKYFPMGKTAHLDLVAEAFNLFNRANVAQINPIFAAAAVPQPGFLQPIAGVGARQIQFSLDFEY